MDKLDRAIALAMDAQNRAQECAVLLEGLNRGAVDDRLSEGIALVRAGKVGAFAFDGVTVITSAEHVRLLEASKQGYRKEVTNPCWYCGNALAGTWKYCPYCGRGVKEAKK